MQMRHLASLTDQKKSFLGRAYFHVIRDYDIQKESEINDILHF